MMIENVKNIDLSISNISDNNSIISSDFDRTNYHKRNSFSSAEISKNMDITSRDDNIDITINIYRYKFTDEFIEELYKFSKIHQYDERKDFKEAWNVWVQEEEELVNTEVRRLTNLGYEGNILDKMFKSARYYFRKKSTEKTVPKARRLYVPVRKELLESMDSHIKSNIHSDDYKPSEGFESFCQQHIELLREEVAILCKNGFNSSEDIKNKFKKTYKNRYFIVTNK